MSPAAMPPAEPTLAVIGLGYVGLPLAVEFASVLPVIGFDIDASRVAELNDGHDRTLEVPDDELAVALSEESAEGHLHLTADPNDLSRAQVFIVTVPTPIDGFRRPDLGPLMAASRTVGAALTPGSIVVYESTVYPGATQEVCVPILEQMSGLVVDRDFSVGYSPERINPGDHAHRLPDILKITSGSTAEAADYIDALYRRIITAGTHRAPSIRVAEAAKVIENTQRDVNIALVNELAMLFARLDIDTDAVLEAAGTKWNFLPFRPGLVGGHCIGVDPYYLTHKAAEVGHHPEMILAGRRINDAMGAHVADRLVQLLANAGRPVAGARVLILGLTFKENTPDLRNTRVVDVVERLTQYAVEVDVSDPWAEAGEAKTEHGINLLDHRELMSSPLGVAAPDSDANRGYDAVVLAVAHREYLDPAFNPRDLLSEGGIVFDVKSALPAGVADARL